VLAWPPTAGGAAASGSVERVFNARMTGASTAQERVRDTAHRHALTHSAWAPQGMGDAPPRRPPGLPGDHAAAAARQGAAGGLLPAERRQLAARRKAAFATEPTGIKQV
jgi:hypothetical protein